MKRSEIREHVFKLLFETEFYEIEEMEQQADYFCKDEENSIPEKEQEEIKERLNLIMDKLPEINEMIAESVTGWSIDRIGKVELTIIRLAVYEIKMDEKVPTNVAINEAVELAKKYGQDGAGSFVNGVLAKFA